MSKLTSIRLLAVAALLFTATSAILATELPSPAMATQAAGCGGISAQLSSFSLYPRQGLVGHTDL